jgi:hypothetical protein
MALIDRTWDVLLDSFSPREAFQPKWHTYFLRRPALAKIL